MLNISEIAKNLKKHRQEFPGIANKVYFNFGGQGPLPRAGLDAIIDAHKYIQHQGPFCLKLNAWIQQRSASTRKAIAGELGATPETITLTENVTVGCNIVLWGIDWKPGDRILMTDCEHPGVIAIVQEIARRFGVEVSTCPIMETLNQGDPVAVIAENLTPKTRLVLLSHILWNTGQLLPLAEIVEVCHNYTQGEYPVQVLVDAAQSVGALPLNLTELKADFYAFTGHKWLCGPVGVGGLYIRPEAFETIAPTFIGWRGINLDEKGQPSGWKSDGQRFEVATSAYPLYEGLKGAIATHKDWGTPAERYEQICHLSAYLWEGLSKIEGIKCLKKTPPEAGLISFQGNNNLSHTDLVKVLEKQGFMLRTIADPNCIRACVHYFTRPSEIEKLIDVLKN
jgi:L-cysteine/cystine lyase